MCTHGSHRNHDTALIQDFIGNAKKSIPGYLSDLKERITIMEKCHNEIQSSIEEVLQVFKSQSE